MRIMALDIGKVRCGIAISDPQEKDRHSSVRSSHRRSACQRTKFSPRVRRLGTGADRVWPSSYYGWGQGSASAVYS